MPYLVVELIVGLVVVMMSGDTEIELVSLQFVGLVLFRHLVLIAFAVACISDEFFPPKQYWHLAICLNSATFATRARVRHGVATS